MRRFYKFNLIYLPCERHDEIRLQEKLINMDPGLVSYILRLTNSFMFGPDEFVFYTVTKSAQVQRYRLDGITAKPVLI